MVYGCISNDFSQSHNWCNATIFIFLRWPSICTAVLHNFVTIRTNLISLLPYAHLLVWITVIYIVAIVLLIVLVNSSHAACELRHDSHISIQWQTGMTASITSLELLSHCHTELIGIQYSAWQGVRKKGLQFAL